MVFEVTDEQIDWWIARLRQYSGLPFLDALRMVMRSPEFKVLSHEEKADLALMIGGMRS
jgi:hypothetical protein